MLLRGCLIFTLLLLLGCKSKTAADGGGAISGEQSKPGSFLAYEHTLRIRSPEPATRLEAARKACVEEQFGACSVLKFDLDDGEETRATLTLRLAPEAVEGLVGIASQGRSNRGARRPKTSPRPSPTRSVKTAKSSRFMRGSKPCRTGRTCRWAIC